MAYFGALAQQLIGCLVSAVFADFNKKPLNKNYHATRKIQFSLSRFIKPNF